ncbi:Fe-S cluster assembly transcription factor [Caldichromatium japonicum]|uniref:Fe-S cluster assembly transcription factor n=1 Tax=Caldichromatium japonicum TaxID=2699430 RepID=A0A6G7VDC3_9GAMM|nr:Fe-S cluster assembly transcription factor [Caldichromatium japonicum]QIK38049.1 Fe-S cluster assembly transcription factor [Caldichromatium japonicum]
MRLTTKGRYAVTAMLDLAIHQGDGPIALADIAQRQGISLSYLEQLFARLRRRGLVTSVRGPGGGYRLARRPAEISVAAVITAVDERVDTTRCGGAGNCQNNGPCLTHDLWRELSSLIYDYLNQINLQMLVDRWHTPDRRTMIGCAAVDLKLDVQRLRVGLIPGPG